MSIEMKRNFPRIRDDSAIALMLEAVDAHETAAPGQSRPAPGPDHGNPALYLNRELSWLNFNWRVLQEASDHRNALLERVKFLAIVSSNIDEFYMKRIGGLR